MESGDKKKLIVIKPNGNHSNRLVQNIYFEVFCREHDIEYHNPTFCDMANYYTEPCCSKTNFLFKMLQIDFLGQLFHHSKVVKKIFSLVWILSQSGCLKLIRFDNADEESTCESRLLKAFEKKDVIYVAGWRFRLLELAEKYRAEMQRKYALKPIFYKDNILVEKISRLKSENYILIGVHIRRGDYKKWKKGKYFYSDEIYEKRMKSLSKQISKKHIFILFSNDNIKFQENENTIISNENWYIDHHIMSLCDYLTGPPSTFTLWASYVGQAKLFHIYDRENATSVLL